jgi:import inner membrane translocase subunit TIM21
MFSSCGISTVNLICSQICSFGLQVNFFIRAPHGHGKVFAEMFKGDDGEWKFTYLIVEIRAPSPAQLILESYIPAYNTNK